MRRILLFITMLAAIVMLPQTTKSMKENKEQPNKLKVVWTSGNRETALKMVFMYALNAKKQDWWEEVTLIIWGPSAQLAAVDEEIRQYLQKMKNAGVKLQACLACANQYEVTDNLKELGVEVKYMGEPLTKFLKAPDTKVVTF